MGNVRLSYTDADNDGSVDPSTEIIEESNYYPFGLEHKGYNDVISPNGNSTAQKWKFQGVELEEALGLDLYEMDFRNYDAAIGRFMSIDPLSEEREWLTPYNFVQNNPILRVDPLGLLDTYGVDGDGNIVWLDGKKHVDENGNEVDRLFAVDSNENKVDTNGDDNVNESDSVEVEKDALANVDSATDSFGSDYDFFKLSDTSQALDVFEFLADNTGVEWSKVTQSSGQSTLSTGHSDETEPGGADILYNLLRKGESNISHTHSHPGPGIPGYSGPSGFHPKDKNTADRDLAIWVDTYYQKGNVKLRVYNQKNGRTITYDKCNTP